MSPCRQTHAALHWQTVLLWRHVPGRTKAEGNACHRQIEPIKVSLQFSQSRKVGKRSHQFHLHHLARYRPADSKAQV
jgi:hypothetical protein